MIDARKYKENLDRRCKAMGWIDYCTPPWRAESKGVEKVTEAKADIYYLNDNRAGETDFSDAFLQDTRISLETKGLLAELTSRSSYIFSAKEIISRGSAGKDKVYRMLKEATKFGYLEKAVNRNGGGQYEKHAYGLNLNALQVPKPQGSSRYSLKHASDSELKIGEKKMSRKSRKNAGGERLPLDWAVSKELEHKLMKDFDFPLSPEIIAYQEQKFRDYWHAEAGRRAVKANWTAAFRNWLRYAAEFGTLAPPYGG